MNHARILIVLKIKSFSKISLFLFLFLFQSFFHFNSTQSFFKSKMSSNTEQIVPSCVVITGEGATLNFNPSISKEENAAALAASGIDLNNPIHVIVNDKGSAASEVIARKFVYYSNQFRTWLTDEFPKEFPELVSFIDIAFQNKVTALEYLKTAETRAELAINMAVVRTSMETSFASDSSFMTKPEVKGKEEEEEKPKN
jgi:hypothetical protein